MPVALASHAGVSPVISLARSTRPKPCFVYRIDPNPYTVAKLDRDRAFRLPQRGRRDPLK